MAKISTMQAVYVPSACNELVCHSETLNPVCLKSMHTISIKDSSKYMTLDCMPVSLVRIDVNAFLEHITIS